MQEGYIVEAFSAQVNQTVRQFLLDNLKEPTLEQNAELAQQHANAFAERLNQQLYFNTADWVGTIQYAKTGIETWADFNGFQHGSNINTIDLARNVF